MNDHATAPGAPQPHPAVWKRLEDQIKWHDERSDTNQRAYKGIKVAQLAVAAAVPVAAAVHAPAWTIALLGGLMLFLEGLQQLGQYQQNWMAYRSTCEALNHEKFLFLARAGRYARRHNPDRALSERVEELVAQEQAKWVAAHEEAAASERAEEVAHAGG